jgi:osmoprotectant transport system permease protein
MKKLLILILVALQLAVMEQHVSAQQIVVGSKRFTESYVLGEIAKKLLDDAGLQVEHKQGMGGTVVLWQALRGGGIDLYPEYSGTISEEILKSKDALTVEAMRDALKQYNIGLSAELGFNNTYALTMRRDTAEKLGITKISDLKDADLRVGLTHEFLKRQDGWEPLAARYGLKMSNLRGIDHALGYAALSNNQIDVKDAYSTDAKIGENDLIVLADDLNFFPQYKAVFLYRLDLPAEAVTALNGLRGTIDEKRMIRLNAEAERTKNYAHAASLYFGEATDRQPSAAQSYPSQLARWLTRHLQLVGISMLLAIVVGIPLGIWASHPGWASKLILATVGMIQTIPSLALLALLIPFLGISATNAIMALFLYSLLPIVRNTATGLQEISPALRESTAALGLEPGAQLRKVFLPMASRTILAGIKTSAIINIGTATIAALVGAGGLGEPIISGLNLNDTTTILQGAIPAALLALVVQWGFELVDTLLIPKGLRLLK